MRSNVINLALSLILLCASTWARCKNATSDQIPHGANELIVLDEQTVARLDGTALYEDGDPAGEVVVEIYSYQGRAETTESIKGTARIASCVTGSDGAFAFDLPPV